MLRSRREAIARLQGGSTYFREEAGLFGGWAEALGLFVSEAPPELKRPSHEEGNERQLWFQPETNTFLKAT